MHRCPAAAAMEPVAVHLQCARCFAAAVAALEDLACVDRRNVDGRGYVSRLKEESDV